MTESLTDQHLRRLQSSGGPRAARDPAVLALVAEVVSGYPRAKIHWLMDTPEAITNDWYEQRLSRHRLAGMIDRAGSVSNLRGLLAKDLYQYAVDQLRPELTWRLFERLDELLRGDPDRFMMLIPAPDPGATCWTLAARPATAMFSDRDPELKSLVWAVGLKTLEEKPDAKKQTQFIVADELARYAYEMLDRSGRGLTLDQLLRGLVVTYGLTPNVEELPDESMLAGRHYAAERAGIPMSDAPPLPTDDCAPAARYLMDAFTERQLEIFKCHVQGYTKQREIAELLGYSEPTISAEMTTIRNVISQFGTREELLDILAAATKLLYGDDHEL
jgi:DNA-binding CsgD family transcriptional regulator